MAPNFTIGIIGGTGMLGGAIARRLLSSGCIPPDRLVVSNRSGIATGLETWPEVRAVTANQELVKASEAVLLAVPPAQIGSLQIDATDKLVISVMAGVSRERLAELSGSSQVVRGMSSPAAEFGLAYSPWIATEAVTDHGRETVRALFSACGETDEIADESHIECFTALTGPVPGFVAYFADCMVKYAVGSGIDGEIAERAIGQLFFAGGTMLKKGRRSPAMHVEEMIDYAGTTAAGLIAMRDTGLAALVAEGLDASVRKTRTIA